VLTRNTGKDDANTSLQQACCEYLKGLRPQLRGWRIALRNFGELTYGTTTNSAVVALIKKTKTNELNIEHLHAGSSLDLAHFAGSQVAAASPSKAMLGGHVKSRLHTQSHCCNNNISSHNELDVLHSCALFQPNRHHRPFVVTTATAMIREVLGTRALVSG